MQFIMDTYKGCDWTNDLEIAKWVCANLKPVPDQSDNLLIKIEVLDETENYALTDETLKFLEEDFRKTNCIELWIYWNEIEGELTEWWITADNI